MKKEDDFTGRAGHGEKYSRKKDEAIARLLTASTQREAARQTGVCEKTLSRWRKRLDFESRLRKEQRRIVDEAVNAAAKAAPDIVEGLREVVWDRSQKGRDRTGAAKVILDVMCKVRKELADAEERDMAREEERIKELEAGAAAPPSAHEAGPEGAHHGQSAPAKAGDGSILVSVPEEERQGPDSRCAPGDAGGTGERGNAEPPNQPSVRRRVRSL
jgi:hypothetical protein